ncbi:MAG: class I SAM-dependent methyltransferase [Novosphingobium sp.]|nr:class I SAM-dependent methyltransferase [Novosphingobium sp.]
MNAQMPARGAELIAGGRAIAAGPQWLARLFAGGAHRILDRIDAGLERGSVETRLPDGSTRLLGGREPGFAAAVELRSYRPLLRLATAGSVGWYQGWDAGEWTSPDPVALFALFMDNSASLGDAARARGPWRLVMRAVHRLRRNSKAGAARNIHAHYDLGNDFYGAWLGDKMIYSSGVFADAETAPGFFEGHYFERLDRAQAAKVERIAERLALKGGDEVLEIGCGWGTVAAFLAERFASRVTAISLSREQLDFARRNFAGLERGRAEFRYQDYRDVAGAYDAIVSIEMVEALGREYWPEFMDCIARNLRANADFIQAYVFPGGMLIRTSEFRRLAEQRGLAWQDESWFGLDYAETLRLWRQAFEDAVEAGRLPAGFDERFVRLWRYYLMYCEGGFRGGGIDVAQVTLVKPT